MTKGTIRTERITEPYTVYEAVCTIGSDTRVKRKIIDPELSDTDNHRAVAKMLAHSLAPDGFKMMGPFAEGRHAFSWAFVTETRLVKVHEDGPIATHDIEELKQIIALMGRG